MSVVVPPAFAALGFSGLFHLETGFPDAETKEGYCNKAPCLLRDPGWMLLEVVDDVGVLVRRDAAAIIDVFKGKEK